MSNVFSSMMVQNIINKIVRRNFDTSEILKYAIDDIKLKDGESNDILVISINEPMIANGEPYIGRVVGEYFKNINKFIPCSTEAINYKQLEANDMDLMKVVDQDYVDTYNICYVAFSLLMNHHHLASNKDLFSFRFVRATGDSISIKFNESIICEDLKNIIGNKSLNIDLRGKSIYIHKNPIILDNCIIEVVSNTSSKIVFKGNLNDTKEYLNKEIFNLLLSM